MAGFLVIAVLIGTHFYTVKILLDGRRGRRYQYLYDVKINHGERPMQQPVTTQAARHQSGADSDGMRRAVSEGRRRIAARTQRHALSQRPQSAIRGARRALVRRRRHAARLPSRERPRQLPQPLGPHPEMAGRARRRPRAVRRLRPQAARCAGLDHAGWRRRQHQHHLSRRPPAGAGGRPSADRDRARHAEHGAATATTTAASPDPSPRIRRSIRSPARWCSSATTPPDR